MPIIRLVLRAFRVAATKVKNIEARLQPFMPVSNFMIMWYFLVIAVLLVDYFLTIYFICFHSWKQDFQGKSVTLPFLIVILISDMFISFNTSFIENGRIITNKSTLRIRYIRSVIFPLDLLVAVVTIVQISTQASYPFLNFIVYIKIIKLSKFDTLITMYVLRSQNVKLAYYIFKHLILLVMVCHLIGSFFFYLDIKLVQIGWYSQDDLWIYSSYAYGNIVDLPAVWQYAYSFYYAAVTLSGVAYGDLTPLNQTETAYTLLSLLIPLIFYAYILSVVHGAISERRAKSLEAIKFRRIAKQYVQQSGIQACEIPRFVNYLAHASQNSSNMDNTYLDQTAPSLRNAYLRSVIGQGGYDFTIFHPLSTHFIKIQEITQIVYQSAGEEAYPSRQPIRPLRGDNIKLYYISSGQISQFIIMKDKKFNKIIRQGNFICQYAFFTGLVHQNTSHQLETYQFTVFHYIELGKFMEKARKSPLFENYHVLKNQLVFQSKVDYIKMNCLFCEEYSHILQNCGKLRYEADISEALRKPNYRNLQFIRKKRQSNKKIDHMGPMMNLLTISFMLNRPKTEEKSTQTDQKQGNGQYIKLAITNFESIENWKYFCPQYYI